MTPLGVYVDQKSLVIPGLFGACENPIFWTFNAVYYKYSKSKGADSE